MIEFLEEDNIADVLVENEKNKILSFLYFTATWCGPCQKIYPLIKELSNKLKADDNYNIIFYKIDIDQNEEFCEKCDIRSVPTFFIMNGKKLLSSITGSDIKKIGQMIINTFNKFNLTKSIKK